MSKILLAIKSMINSANKISDVCVDQGGKEYFFKYDNKSVWGIMKNEDEYYLYLYPQTKNTNDLLDIMNWELYPMVVYNTKDAKTSEDYNLYSELYAVVKEKLYNVDVILDDIIDSAQ